MAKALTSVITSQITKKDIKYQCIFKINNVDVTEYLMSYDLSYSKDFGSASGVFSLNNNDARFGLGGTQAIEVGDTIELIEQYKGDTTEWKSFYGFVDQRSFQTTAVTRTITLNCLDYISRLQHLDIDIELEGTKFKVTNETLTPNYLPAPNDSLAQVFDFANNAVAQNPLPILSIVAQAGTSEDPQSDGFEVLYAQGQVKLGTPLNVLDNYHLKARSYYAYARGIYAEDILESILKEQTGYSQYLFDEASAADVVTNHLLETFLNVNGTSTDTLTPNTAEQEISIYTQLTAAVSSGTDTIQVESTEGFPSAGEAEINGDVFAYTSKDSTHFYGVTPSGSETAIKNHPIDAYVKYTETYVAGRVWYLTYSNVQTDMTVDDFDGVTSGNFAYFDKRYGRILLDTAISILDVVTCSTNYTFKTLQATGIEINAISFRTREVENRFDAIKKLREFLAPNWIIYTVGDNKIWASYLAQKFTADYTLNLLTSITQLEDDDLYTRVNFYGKNKNPNNIMFNTGVEFLESGQNFNGIATQLELTFDREEDNYYVYKSSISGVGEIILGDITPIVYINGQPIDNEVHVIPQGPVNVVVRTTTSDDPGDIVFFYDYDIYMAHSGIVPTENVYFYNSAGVLLTTIPPGGGFANPAGFYAFNYGAGRTTVGGGFKNATIEQFSYASYSVLYSTTDLQIDYQAVEFKIAKSILPNHVNSIVSATFEYQSVYTSELDIKNIIDGRFNTQSQTIFFSEPPTGYNYAILDLGQIYDIQAIDITAGYYKPDSVRKYDIDARLTLQVSDDNIDYAEISSKTNSFNFATGGSVSFEESDLGVGFSTRYLKIIIENLKKIEFGDGVWVISITEIAAYNNIILKSEATLIPTTTLATAIDVDSLGSSGLYPNTVTVVSTAGFTEPESGEIATAYIGEDSFTYTEITATQFLGVEGLSENHSVGARVSQELAGDSTVYDDKGLIQKLGDRLFKKINIDDNFLYDQVLLDRLSRAYLREFVKNHDRLQVEVLFCPYLKVGQTVQLTNVHLNIIAENYFIESFSNRSGYLVLTLARYPED